MFVSICKHREVLYIQWWWEIAWCPNAHQSNSWGQDCIKHTKIMLEYRKTASSVETLKIIATRRIQILNSFPNATVNRWAVISPCHGWFYLLQLKGVLQLLVQIHVVFQLIQQMSCKIGEIRCQHLYRCLMPSLVIRNYFLLDSQYRTVHSPKFLAP